MSNCPCTSLCQILNDSEPSKPFLMEEYLCLHRQKYRWEGPLILIDLIRANSSEGDGTEKLWVDVCYRRFLSGELKMIFSMHRAP